ncbi:MAG: cupin domain-containing protein [Chloroflexi bacterium]|nr:cupin domain-containing protein [Chloroflexota bacterium]
MQTDRLPSDYTALAPDGSEIRELVKVDGGSMAHCTLPQGKTSIAVAHGTVEEVWYFLHGRGQVWRTQDGRESIVDVSPGTALTIPLRASFQFRNTGAEDLCFIIVTIPPWPGEEEAYQVEGRWSAS